MVLIISSEVDQSTNEVIRWLIRDKQEYIRVGEQQFINNLYFTIGDSGIVINLKIGGATVKFSDIKSFWFRKHTLEIMSNLKIKVTDSERVLISPNLKTYLFDEEVNAIKDFIFYELEKKKHLGNYKVREANKLISFSRALSCGMKIPTSNISTDLKWLKSKFIDNGKVIIKPIEDAYSSIYNKIGISTNYNIARSNIFQNKESIIFPSCLQDYVEKKMEIRTFFLKGKCFSMAIFSQSNRKTEIDFRNYDEDKPNRFVPFSLPKNIEAMVINFMGKMKLQTGSLDFILTPRNEYVFLEVNPVGQYGMVSEPCNYNLDKEIAKELSI